MSFTNKIATVIVSDIDRSQTTDTFPFKMLPPSDCADLILRGVERNRGIIPVTALARGMWLFHRLAARPAQLVMNESARSSPLLQAGKASG